MICYNLIKITNYLIGYVTSVSDFLINNTEVFVINSTVDVNLHIIHRQSMNYRSNRRFYDIIMIVYPTIISAVVMIVWLCSNEDFHVSMRKTWNPHSDWRRNSIISIVEHLIIISIVPIILVVIVSNCNQSRIRVGVINHSIRRKVFPIFYSYFRSFEISRLR